MEGTLLWDKTEKKKNSRKVHVAEFLLYVNVSDALTGATIESILTDSSSQVSEL